MTLGGSGTAQAVSALPPKADMTRTSFDVRLVPKAEVMPASDGNFYPWDSKLRPASASAADDRPVNAADGSPIPPETQ
jgi:hypothetical protein